MIQCEDNNIHFDRTKLEKLIKSLERLDKEDEDFRKTAINEEIAEVDKRDRSPKRKQIVPMCQKLAKLSIKNLRKFLIYLKLLQFLKFQYFYLEGKT